MINLKQGGDGNFIMNHTYMPKDKVTFIVTDEYISFMGFYPVIGSQGTRYTYDQFTLDGVVCESYAQFIDWIQANCFKKKLEVKPYLKGVATADTEPVMEGGVMYIVLAPATLPNFKDSEGEAITVTQDDLDAGDVYLIGTDGVFDMQVDATREYVDQKVAGVDLKKVLQQSGTGNTPSSTQVVAFNPNDPNPYYLTFSSNADASSLVRRRSGGQAAFGNPIEQTDTVNLQTLQAATNLKAALLALTKISDPSTATTEQVATLLNNLIDALKA